MPTIFDAAEYDVVELDARSIGLADATADGTASRVQIVYKRIPRLRLCKSEPEPNDVSPSWQAESPRQRQASVPPNFRSAPLLV